MPGEPIVKALLLFVGAILLFLGGTFLSGPRVRERAFKVAMFVALGTIFLALSQFIPRP